MWAKFCIFYINISVICVFRFNLNLVQGGELNRTYLPRLFNEKESSIFLNWPIIQMQFLNLFWGILVAIFAFHANRLYSSAQ